MKMKFTEVHGSDIRYPKPFFNTTLVTRPVTHGLLSNPNWDSRERKQKNPNREKETISRKFPL